VSDVGIAPAPPSPSRETPINPSPVSIPTPLGPQAPSAPVGDVEGKHHPQSRREQQRESLAKAFERARTDPPPAHRPKPGIGDNKPPEPMAKEKPKPPPLDLKKRPVEEPPRRKRDRPRAEHEHFAARSDAPPAGQRRPGTAQQPEQGQGAPGRNPLPPHAPYREPPTRRMSPTAQRDWHQAPETVRADVHRMYREFAKASQLMNADREVMQTIRPYQQLAQQHGTTLARALNNYTSMEDKLRSDPVGGLDVIVNNLNLRTSDGQRIGLRDIAWHVLNQTPDQHQQTQTQNAQTAQSHQIGQLHQTVAALAHGMQQMHYERQFHSTRSEVDRFAETHPRLDELGGLIEQELRLGFDLPTAYRRAELLSPPGSRSAAHAAQTRTTTAQTRSSDRSISGAPDGPVNGTGRRQQPSATPRDAVANAMKRLRA
jgi:hypothetical protein